MCAKCFCVAGWSFSFLDVCHAMHEKVSGAFKGNKQHWWFPLVVKNYQYALFSDFFLGNQNHETIFVTHHNATKKSLPSTGYHSTNCEKTFFTDVCAVPSANTEIIGHKFSCIKNVLSHGTMLCPIPISAAISLTVTCHFALRSSSVFPLFLSLEAVCWWPL